MRSFGFTLVPVCYVYSKLLRKSYPVAESCDSSKRPFRALALRSLMWLDRWVRPGFGIRPSNVTSGPPRSFSKSTGTAD